jgi:transcriptional regulator with PAS, ATPase and Fis domain
LVRRQKKAGDFEWFEDLPCAITVCDRNYKILYMNEKSAKANRDEGGKALIGKNLMDCHPPEAQEKLKEVMISGRPNAYTVEKKGVKKLVYQSHWRKKGQVGGLVELNFELPDDMPTRKRI